MGQKVNPHGLRVGVIKDWDSRWYASDEKVGDLIVEDQKIRKYLKKTLYGVVSRISVRGLFYFGYSGFVYHVAELQYASYAAWIR